MHTRQHTFDCTTFLCFVFFFNKNNIFGNISPFDFLFLKICSSRFDISLLELSCRKQFLKFLFLDSYLSQGGKEAKKVSRHGTKNWSKKVVVIFKRWRCFFEVNKFLWSCASELKKKKHFFLNRAQTYWIRFWILEKAFQIVFSK